MTRLGTKPKFSGAGLSRINERSDTRKGVLAMSQPYARFLHTFDVARHPDLEPEVKRAILASWASDRSAVRDKPALRKPPGATRAVPIEEVPATTRTLDDSSHERRVGHDCVSTCRPREA